MATPQEQRTKEALEKIEAAISQITTSEKWEEHLKWQAKFPNYSANNILWLKDQAEARGATLGAVAGYRKWEELGYQVQKGEKSFSVLAPITIRIDPDQDIEGKKYKVVGFKTAPVFDISQTKPIEGKPQIASTSFAQRLEKDAPEKLKQSVMAEIEKSGYKVNFLDGQDWSPSKNGETNPSEKTVSIRADMSQAQELKTLVHELAHIKFEHTSSHTNSEVEAESTAFVVLNHFGIDSGDYSFGYVASWSNGDVDILRKTAQGVGKISNKIIDNLNETLQEVQKQEPALEHAMNLQISPQIANTISVERSI